MNESNLILLRRPDGTNLGVRQVSGAVARRIVCPLRQGDALQRAARFGMIKFGSTTELIVPDSDSEDLAPIIHVETGESVRAGPRTQELHGLGEALEEAQAAERHPK